MISAPDRRQAVGLIREACQGGARLKRACAELGIDVRTYQRWRGDAEVKADARPGALRPEPVNKLSAEERAQVLALCHAPA
jgi:putative transposase